jgi:hypothetical protein
MQREPDQEVEGLRGFRFRLTWLVGNAAGNILSAEETTAEWLGVGLGLSPEPPM